MIDDTDPIDFETAAMLARYAEGEPVVDVGDSFKRTVNSVYNAFREHPSQYKEAKEKLVLFRNAKYRRAGALAIDKQLKFLEEMPDDQETLSSEMTTIIKIGETAEKRADLNEGKATEITKEIGTKFTIEMPDGFKGKNIT